VTEIEAKDGYATVHVEDIPDGIVNVGSVVKRASRRTTRARPPWA
jgi:hypothetical protein